MTNLTLAIDEQILQRARIRAIQRGTSVDALVRDYIARLAGESDAEDGVAQFHQIVSGGTASSGSAGRTWTRDELYDR